MPEYYTEPQIQERLEQIVYPTARVIANKASGSGTVVFSGQIADGTWRTYVITCHHVIEKNIEIKTKYDPRVGMEVKKETRTPVTVQFFRYEKLSHCRGSSGYRAKIVDYDAAQDIALLELELYEKSVDFISNLFPIDKIDNIHISDVVYAVGAALGQEPMMTKGIINFMNVQIEGFEYWLSSAPTIFGNSGGAIFRFDPTRERFEYIGIPARIAVTMSGFGAIDAITHLGYLIPIPRIYSFLKEGFYDFIFDPEKTFEQSEKERKIAKEKAEMLFYAKFGGRPIE